MFLATLHSRVEQYARGKTWYWYVPLWLVGFYLYTQLLTFDMLKPLSPALLIPYSFDFMLHEWAHIFTAFLPPLLTASAGSVSELTLGVVLVIWGFRERSYFASFFSLLWFELTCQSAGTYMADAVPQRLPLVSLGGALSGQEPLHDWHFVFGQLHLLPASALIGDVIRVIGALAGTFGLLFSAWLIYEMSQAPSWAASEDETLLLATAPEQTPLPRSAGEDVGFTSMPLKDDELRGIRPGGSPEGKRD